MAHVQEQELPPNPARPEPSPIEQAGGGKLPTAKHTKQAPAVFERRTMAKIRRLDLFSRPVPHLDLRLVELQLARRYRIQPLDALTPVDRPEPGQVRNTKLMQLEARGESTPSRRLPSHNSP